jgi:hypothetical protein
MEKSRGTPTELRPTCRRSGEIDLMVFDSRRTKLRVIRTRECDDTMAVLA